MKRYWPVLMFSLLAAVVYADTAPVSLQSILKAAPKANPIGSDTHLTAMKGSTLVYVNATSIKPAVATTTSPGIVKVGNGLAVTADGTLNNTGLAGVASFKGRGGAVVPTTGDYTASMITGLATVGISGSYTDLINQPAIPAAQVPSDWTASSGVARILNKPTVPTALSQLTQDATHRTVTDAEKSTWNTSTASVNSVNDKTGTVTLTATDVGADPLGSATSVQTNLTAHTGATNNPHSVTKAQVGLSNVDNTSDANKPVSTATQAALDLKATVAASNTWPTFQNFSGGIKASDVIAKGPVIDTRHPVYAGGAKWDGTHDDTAAINAAIAALPMTGGTLLVGGSVKLTSTIAPDRPVIFKSVTPISYLNGIGDHTPQGATFAWRGGAAPVFSITAQSGVYFENVIIDGNGTATNCIYADRWQEGGITNSLLRGATVSALKLHTSAPSLHANTMWLRFYGLFIRSTTDRPIEMTTADGAKANECHLTFIGTRIHFAGDYAIYMADADNNTFYDTYVYRDSGTGYALYLGTNARSNYFYHLQPAGGVLVDRDAVTWPLAGGNVIYGYDRENSQPQPTFINGADNDRLIWHEVGGRYTGSIYGSDYSVVSTGDSQNSRTFTIGRVGALQNSFVNGGNTLIRFVNRQGFSLMEFNPATGAAKIKGTLEAGVDGSSGGVTKGDVYIDGAGKAVYVGRLSSNASDDTVFHIRNHTGADIFTANPTANTVTVTGALSAPSLTGAAITDSTSTSSSTTAASATAVKAAYDLANGKPSLTSTAPNMDGVASAGSGVTAARVDHVHPADTTKAPVDNPTFTTGITTPLIKADDIVAKGPWLDVRHSTYGFAANSSVGSASANSTALRTALPDAHANGNKVVLLPPGTAYVDNSSGPIVIPVGVTLRGAGKYWDGGTTIHFTDNTQDGFVLATAVDGGSPGIEDMWITGAKRGIYNQTGGMITAKRLTLDGNVIGIELDGTNYSHFEDIKASNNGTGGILTYNGIRFADQNTFINCRWDKNTGMGLVKRKGTGNTFISNTFVGNEGIGLYLEEPSASTVDANFMWYPNHVQSAPDVFISPYFEDVFGGTNTDELLKIVNVWNTEFVGAIFMNYYTKTNGVINLTRAGRTKISGTAIDSASPLISNFVNVGFASWETDIDLVGVNQASVMDKGVNTKIGSRWNVDSTAYDSEASTMSNVTFGTAGAGGADILANWTENGATDMQLDTSDLMYPGTVSSLRVNKGVPAVSSSVTQATRTLTSGKTYYINITYKNDSATASKLGPITVGLQKAAGGYLDYNFVDGTWAYSNGGKSLALPISTTPYSVSIPFTIPSATAAQLTISFNAYSGDNDGATYHLYRASIDTVPNSGNIMATVQAANQPIANLGATAIPFTDLSGHLLSGSLGYDNVNKVLNVGKGVDATPVVQIEGSSNASFRTKDTGAGADAKVMLYRTDGGVTGFSSLTDAGAFNKQNIISMNHSTGAVTIPNTLTAASLAGTAITDSTSTTSSTTAASATAVKAAYDLANGKAAANLTGTTTSIGGGALTAGTCTSGTVAVAGATTGMAVSASPVAYPGDGVYWQGYVSASNTVTVKVCGAVSVTPTATTYNVRVLQ